MEGRDGDGPIKRIEIINSYIVKASSWFFLTYRKLVKQSYEVDNKVKTNEYCCLFEGLISKVVGWVAWDGWVAWGGWVDRQREK